MTTTLDVIDLYLARRRMLGGWSEQTDRQTGYLLRSWARHLGGEDWREPDPDDVLAWATVPPSLDGRARRMCCVRTFYRHSVRWGGAFDEDTFPRLQPSDGIPRPCPDRIYRAALLSGDPADRRALQLGRLAGLRAGEIAAVHSDHLDGQWLWVRGKGQRERWVAAHPTVAVLTREAGGWVFPNAGAGHWRSGTISARLSELLPDPWTAHTLRHAFATQLYDETRDLVVVAAQLGHRSTKTTERYVKGRNARALDAVRGWAA